MGVTGLLPFLKKIHQPINISKFAGCTVAIDAYCWLHKGAFSCAEKLALGEKTDQYVYYCMKFINNLLAKNIKPVMVFDGCHLPSKKNVEKTRREKREMNRKKAAQFLREGRRAEARECLQRCIDISPEMALELMNVCRSKGVDCIVAPYEADAQLAYLNRIGVAQVVITEDSDLLLFGCEKVLFKMDHAGNGILIERSRLNEVMDLQTGHYTFDKFRYMCILSGCDYLPSLSGIGLAKANKVFKLARQSDLQQLLKKLSTYLKSNISVPQEYIDGFIQANNTFLYQLVFDPLQRKLVPLTPYPSDVKQEDVPYAGPYISANRAYQLALGNINIYSNEIFSEYDPDTYVPKYVKKKAESLHLLSIWDKNYRIRPKAGLTEAQPSDRPVLKGKEITVKSNFKKTSPKKRLREVEDSHDVRTNSELSSLYEQESPSKKKLKRDDIGDELQRFMFSAQQRNSQENTENTLQEETEQVTEETRPQFFSSLSEAHPQTGDTTVDLKDDDKENGLKSPNKNVFACKSPSRRPKFDLNAAKPQELKSRFFAKSSKQLKLSGSVRSTINRVKNIQRNPMEEKSISGFRLVHENTANVKSNSTSLKPDIHSENQKENSDQKPVLTKSESESLLPTPKVFTFDKHKAVASKACLQSPTSAFNWSKFKFASKSCDSATNSTLTGIGKSVSQPDVSDRSKEGIIKSKVSNCLPDSESSCEIQREPKENVSSPNSCYNEKMGHEIEQPANETQSSTDLDHGESSLGSSYPYSIDQECLPSLSDLSCIDSQSQQCCDSEDISSQTSVQSASSTQSKKRGLSIYFRKISSDGVTGNETERDIPTDIDDTDKTKKINKDTADTVVVIGSDDDEPGTSNAASDKVKRSSVSMKSPRFSKGKTKSGCRVSGLSRKSKSLSLEDTGKQQSLKDMFSKFAHSKNSKPKISHDGDVACTPETEASMLNRDDKIKRHLDL